MPTLAELLPAESFDGLRSILVQHWARSIARAVAMAAEATDTDPRELARAEVVKRLMGQAGERIVDIEDTTRERVMRYVQRARDEELTPAELAKMIEADPSGAFNKARARMVARTETATAWNQSSIASYAASGRVTHVTVMDNEGPNSCEECEAANGQTWTLAQAHENPTEHPHCVRAFSPVVRALADDS